MSESGFFESEAIVGINGLTSYGGLGINGGSLNRTPVLPPEIMPASRPSFVGLVAYLALLSAGVLPGNAEPSLSESIFSEATRAMAEAGTPAGVDADRLWRERQAGAELPGREEARTYALELAECERLAVELGTSPDLDDPATAELHVLLLNQDHALAAAQPALVERFAAVRAECVAKGYPREILDRHDAAVRDQLASHEMVLGMLGRLRAAGADAKARTEALDLIVTWFSQNPVTREVPLSGDPEESSGHVEAVSVVVDRAELDLSPAGFALVPQAPGPMSLQSPPVPADLAQTLEVQFTAEITALATELDSSPLKIFNWVRTHIEFDPYVGSRRGAAETLRLRAGNDMDQASLLISLLRASGFPARYVVGMVEMPAAAAANWLGVEDPFTAGSILTTAGLEGVTITNGSEVDAIRCRRVWVEAHLPYSDYRGAGAAAGEPLWIRLDPAFKPTDLRLGIDVVSESGFNPDSFLSTYFASTDLQTVLGKFEQTLEASLAAMDPPVALADNLLLRPPAPVDLPWLPASLPNKLLSVDTSFAEIPANRRFSVRFRISGEGSTLDHTLALPSIAGKQVTISYIGATQADRDLIAASGGLFGVPQPWLVQVVPQLRVDGCIIATGSGAVTLGKVQSSQFYFTTPFPNATTDSISNIVIAGNYQGNAIDTGRAVVDPENRPLACPEDFTGGMLHRLGMLYLELNDQADRHTASLMQAVLWKGVSNAILAQQVKVAYSGSTPLTFDYAGLSVDADRAGATSFSAYGNDIRYAFGRIRGAQSSQNENLVFEVNLGRESVSTIKILRLAGLLGIPLFEITSANAATLIPQLNQSVSTKNSVAAEVNAGKRVTIPRDAFTYFDWSGTGYIQLDPVNGTGGYIISGGISGGATAEEDDKKPGCEKVTSVDIVPPAPGNVYSSCQKEPVEITVILTQYDENCDISGTRTVKKTVSPSQVAPQTYQFKFGSAGDCGCSEQTVTITIKETAAIFTDSDKRRSIAGILEIARNGSEDIRAQAPGATNAMWAAGGDITPSSQNGEDVTFNANVPNSVGFLPGALLPIPALFNMMFPNAPSTIEATNLADTCGTSVQVFPFPENAFEFNVPLLSKKDRDDSADKLGTLKTLVEMVDKVEDISTAMQLYSEYLGAPVVPKFTKSGAITINDQIKEVSDSNRVEYVLAGGVKGEFALKGLIPVLTTTLAGVPPNLANAYIAISYGGTLGASLVADISYQRPGKFTKVSLAQAELSGRVSVGLEAKASLASGFAEVTASATSGFGFKLPFGASVSGSKLTVGGDLSFPVGGLVMTYQYGVVWGAWTVTDTWNAVPPVVFPSSGPIKIKGFEIDFGS